MVFVASNAIIEAWIYEQLGTNPLIEPQSECVFPLHLCSFIAGISIQACLPLQHVHNLPRQVDSKLRTEIIKEMMVLIHSQTFTQVQLAGIFHVIGKRSKMDGALQLVAKPVDVIIHTDRHVQIERSKEVRNIFRREIIMIKQRIYAG